MICPYCQSPLIDNKKKADLLCPQCLFVHFSIDKLNQISLITLVTVLGNNTYYLMISPNANSKAVLAWEALDFTSHDWKFLPKEISQTVNPMNFHEKLKIYLTFL